MHTFKSQVAKRGGGRLYGRKDGCTRRQEGVLFYVKRINEKEKEDEKRGGIKFDWRKL